MGEWAGDDASAEHHEQEGPSETPGIVSIKSDLEVTAYLLRQALVEVYHQKCRSHNIVRKDSCSWHAKVLIPIQRLRGSASALRTVFRRR